MTDNVKKVFEMLGVEPGERFNLKNNLSNSLIPATFWIDDDLRIKCVEIPSLASYHIEDLLNGTFSIVKLPKKKQVKNLTEDEIKKICDKSLGCVSCPLKDLALGTNATVITCYKEELIDYIMASRNLPSYFLNSEVEIPEEAK